MKILGIKPAADRGSGVRTIALFDLELTDAVRMYGLRLLEAPDGRRLVYAPNGNGGRRLATFSPELAAAISRAATDILEGHDTADGTYSEN
jgi:hypothetical protein